MKGRRVCTLVLLASLVNRKVALGKVLLVLFSFIFEFFFKTFLDYGEVRSLAPFFLQLGLY